ncbi:MarR family transcriptional regulator [Agrobacterium vitis]|uniref:MarR family winged helix-turn-helix transcriptional regulator n=1 Tax=Allorhizobium ampelinum TaxID=3025782 RepID=UPI00300C8EFB|nr:MarR family transcriptional regulator [Allorhizobium ampelinum]
MSNDEHNSKGRGGRANAPDETDIIQQEWALARPDLPVRSIGVITRIWRIAKLLSDHRRHTMNQLGMEPAIRDLLANLRRSDPPYRLRVGELAARCHVSKGAITQRVERAVSAGLVRTTSARVHLRESPASNDKRAVWIELTPHGKERVEATVEALLTHEDSLIAELGDAEIANLSDSLRWLLGHLEKRVHIDGIRFERSDF